MIFEQAAKQTIGSISTPAPGHQQMDMNTLQLDFAIPAQSRQAPAQTRQPEQQVGGNKVGSNKRKNAGDEASAQTNDAEQPSQKKAKSVKHNNKNGAHSQCNTAEAGPSSIPIAAAAAPDSSANDGSAKPNAKKPRQTRSRQPNKGGECNKKGKGKEIENQAPQPRALTASDGQLVAIAGQPNQPVAEYVIVPGQTTTAGNWSLEEDLPAKVDRRTRTNISQYSVEGDSEYQPQDGDEWFAAPYNLPAQQSAEDGVIDEDGADDDDEILMDRQGYPVDENGNRIEEGVFGRGIGGAQFTLADNDANADADAAEASGGDGNLGHTNTRRVVRDRYVDFNPPLSPEERRAMSHVSSANVNTLRMYQDRTPFWTFLAENGFLGDDAVPRANVLPTGTATNQSNYQVVAVPTPEQITTPSGKKLGPGRTNVPLKPKCPRPKAKGVRGRTSPTWEYHPHDNTYWLVLDQDGTAERYELQLLAGPTNKAEAEVLHWMCQDSYWNCRKPAIYTQGGKVTFMTHAQADAMLRGSIAGRRQIYTRALGVDSLQEQFRELYQALGEPAGDSSYRAVAEEEYAWMLAGQYHNPVLALEQKAQEIRRQEGPPPPKPKRGYTMSTARRTPAKPRKEKAPPPVADDAGNSTPTVAVSEALPVAAVAVTEDPGDLEWAEALRVIQARGCKVVPDA
jgi:hypothetical protein